MHINGPNGVPYDRDTFESFIDEVTQRQFETNPFGAPVRNQYADVPIYNQFNTGLAMTADTYPRLNMAVDPMEMNSPMAPDRYTPIISNKIGNLGGPTEEMKLESMKRRGLLG
jgi:hypothetical protein